MRNIFGAIVLAGGLAASGLAAAEEQTVTLAISGMTCPACSYIVGQSLASVDGVTAVDVWAGDERAIVSFDDAKCDIADLINATSEYGFPSELVESETGS